ncbi:agmatine deiminase family protein [Bradyrhizobium ottawaense]|uniref:agmatine deiminase family protein n=1 Tax=Bradyrhizobium ottawaense TaxID=931866 RepID=UPI0030F39748
MSGLRLVPDWIPHSYCWMAWAIDPSEWGKDARGARQELREVIATISRFEKVRLLTPPNLLGDARAQHFGSDVEIVEAPVDDIWMRDIAPIYALSEGEPVCIDLNFNGWGSTNYRRARPGDRLAGVARDLFASTMLNAPFVAEGGAFVVGHDAVVFTTRSCLLNPNRNPHFCRSDIEAGLIRLGAKKVVWLEGDPDEKITSGHVDGYILPAESGELLIQRTDARDHSAMLRNLDIRTLQGLRAADRNAVPVRLVSAPRIAMRTSEFFADSYVNVYTPNAAVVAPRFGDPLRDADARRALERAFPGRKVEMLSIPHLASGGGGIRCLVQPVPASTAV